MTHSAQHRRPAIVAVQSPARQQAPSLRAAAALAISQPVSQRRPAAPTSSFSFTSSMMHLVWKTCKVQEGKRQTGRGWQPTNGEQRLAAVPLRQLRRCVWWRDVHHPGLPL